MIGALELHFTNIFLSDIASSFGADVLKLHPNPCVWYPPLCLALRISIWQNTTNPPLFRYFLNLFVDCTIGVPILWINLKLLHRICRFLKLRGTRSGIYGDPLRWTWWLKQVVVYCIGVCWMKIGTLIVLGSLPYLDKVGELIVGWTKGNTALQIIFVMFVWPFPHPSLSLPRGSIFPVSFRLLGFRLLEGG